MVVVAIHHGPDGRGCHHHRLPLTIPTRTTHRILGATVVEIAGLFLRPPVFPGCVSVRRGAAREGLPSAERETHSTIFSACFFTRDYSSRVSTTVWRSSPDCSNVVNSPTAITPRAAHALESQAWSSLSELFIKVYIRTCHIWSGTVDRSSAYVCMVSLANSNSAPPGPFRGFLHLPPPLTLARTIFESRPIVHHPQMQAGALTRDIPRPPSIVCTSAVIAPSLHASNGSFRCIHFRRQAYSSVL